MKVAEYLSAFDISINYIDCTDSYRPSKYGTGHFRKEVVEKPEILKMIPRFYKRYGISIGEFVERTKFKMPYDLILVTSQMSYWYPGVQKVTEILRDMFLDTPIILGGTYATLYREHAIENTGIDAIYVGELNRGFIMLLETFGFRLKKKREASPYYRLGLYNRYPFAPLLTGSGCPFNCVYCASGLLSQTYNKRSIEDILKEIKELYSAGVRDFAFYDDALLLDAENHIKPLLRSIISLQTHEDNMNFHTPNGLHARFLDEELAFLMKRANFKTIRLSLETVNPLRQQESGGKVSNEDLMRAVRNLKKAGFSKREIGVYLMYGLPDQSIDEVRDGIEFLKGLDVRINLTEFSPIRGTRLWDDLVKKGIISESIDPLLTNNTIFPFIYSGLDPAAIQKMKTEVNIYNSA